MKAMAQPCDVIRYYITFVAKEAVAGGQTKTYQAVVRNGVEDDDIVRDGHTLESMVVLHRYI
jgi:hypothetical protein